MSNKDDTGEIIKEFLDLWQKQFAYMTKDTKTVTNMLKMFQQAQEGYFNSLRKENNAKPGSTADIYSNVNDELRKLKQRVANLEARVTELEPKARKPGKKTAKANSGKKSGAASKRAAKPTGQ